MVHKAWYYSQYSSKSSTVSVFSARAGPLVALERALEPTSIETFRSIRVESEFRWPIWALLSASTSSMLAPSELASYAS